MWTIKLLRFNQVPSDFHEPHIIHGYRSCRSSLLSCLASATQGSNETLNFWTHFLPFTFFAWITWGHVADGSFVDDPFTWPLICFLVSCCLYLLASACAHLFNCISVPARYVAFFFDYGAISIYSLGCSIAYYAYVFPPELLHTSLYAVYLPVAGILAALCTALTCHSRLSSWEMLRHSGRLPGFMLPYVWCSIPLLHRAFFCQEPDCYCDAMLYHVRQFLGAFITALFYASRFPEILSPGTFDVFGHSHQFFHIGGALATYSQYTALYIDMEERREFLVGATGTPTFLTSGGAFLGVLVLNLLVIWAFSYVVSRPHALEAIKCKQGLEGLEEEDTTWRGHGWKCD